MPSSSQGGGQGGTPPRPVNAPSAPTSAAVQAGVGLGVVRARQVIIVGGGGELLVYSPSAAFGNLIASVAAQDFTDPYKNAGLAGIASYTNALFASAAVMFGGTVNWWEAATPAGPWTVQAGIGFGFSSGTGGFLAISATASQLQLAFNGGVIPQAGASGITTVSQLVAALEAAGILTP